MTCTWEQLADLRASGKRPTLPVHVTTDERHAKRQMFEGVMAIVHHAGEPMPVELLEGLRVVWVLDHCGQAAAVNRLVTRREVSIPHAQAWCHCQGAMTSCVGPCEEMREIDDWMFSK